MQINAVTGQTSMAASEISAQLHTRSHNDPAILTAHQKQLPKVQPLNAQKIQRSKMWGPTEGLQSCSSCMRPGYPTLRSTCPDAGKHPCLLLQYLWSCFLPSMYSNHRSTFTPAQNPTTATENGPRNPLTLNHPKS